MLYYQGFDSIDFWSHVNMWDTNQKLPVIEILGIPSTNSALIGASRIRTTPKIESHPRRFDLYTKRYWFLAKHRKVKAVAWKNISGAGRGIFHEILKIHDFNKKKSALRMNDLRKGQGRWVEVRGYLNDTQKYADGMSVSFNVWIRTIKIIKKKWRVKIV